MAAVQSHSSDKCAVTNLSGVRYETRARSVSIPAAVHSHRNGKRHSRALKAFCFGFRFCFLCEKIQAHTLNVQNSVWVPKQSGQLPIERG